MTDTNVEVEAELSELVPAPVFVPIEEGERFGVALPPEWTFDSYDEERYLARPRRPRGRIAVFDAASFVSAVNMRRTGDAEPVVYADEEAFALVAVLNDDLGADGPGWRDYRVELSLRPTPEWLHWTKLDGKLVAQETFAEHVEDGVNELRSPAAAVMLDIAQSIHGHVNARVKSARRLHDGRVQFAYEEEQDAAAGADGTVSIPETLSLVLRPFIGADPYEVTARFRYRLRPDVTLGYKLDRPHEVKRAAFTDIRNTVERELGPTTISGPAPGEV